MFWLMAHCNQLLDDIFVDINVRGVSNRLQYHIYRRIYYLYLKQVFQDFSIASGLAFLMGIV
jgi:hypothetical protein